MNIQKYKNYLPFAISLILFIVMLLFCIAMYITWDGATEEEIETSVEVNLPVIEWGKYTNLSKQYDSDKILNN